MFWIGLIVGVIITVIAYVVWMAYCVKNVCGSRYVFRDFVDVVEAAHKNRKSDIRVYHNGELLDVVFFEEKK